MLLYFAGFVVCMINAVLINGQTYICENTKDELSCPNGQVINIINAFYGRQNSSICSTNGTKSNVTNCSLQNAADIVSNLCNGQQNCTIFINGTDFKDPCPNVTKYLSVDFKCITVTPTTCGCHEHYSSLVCDCINRCQTPDSSCLPFCRTNGGCVCNIGFKKDPITGKCVAESLCPQGANLNTTHEVYSACANNQPTCRYPFRWFPLRCLPGYECVSGYLRDVYSSKCVRKDECPRGYRRWKK